MAVRVSFFTPRGIGAVEAPGFGAIRKSETVALSGVSQSSTEEAEAVWVFNGGTDPILAAHGSAPDAAAATSTATTSAGVAIGGGQGAVLVPAENAKISVTALA